MDKNSLSKSDILGNLRTSNSRRKSADSIKSIEPFLILDGMRRMIRQETKIHSIRIDKILISYLEEVHLVEYNSN